MSFFSAHANRNTNAEPAPVRFGIADHSLFSTLALSSNAEMTKHLKGKSA